MNETSKPSQISRLIIALRELKSAINYRDACVVGGFSPMRITDAALRLVQALIDAEAVLDSIPSDEDSNFLPLSRTEQSAQGERCGCGGGDELCACQNQPDKTTRQNRRRGSLTP